MADVHGWHTCSAAPGRPRITALTELVAAPASGSQKGAALIRTWGWAEEAQYDDAWPAQLAVSEQQAAASEAACLAVYGEGDECAGRRW